MAELSYLRASHGDIKGKRGSCRGGDLTTKSGLSITGWFLGRKYSIHTNNICWNWRYVTISAPCKEAASFFGVFSPVSRKWKEPLLNAFSCVCSTWRKCEVFVGDPYEPSLCKRGGKRRSKVVNDAQNKTAETTFSFYLNPIRRITLQKRGGGGSLSCCHSNSQAYHPRPWLEENWHKTPDSWLTFNIFVCLCVHIMALMLIWQAANLRCAGGTCIFRSLMHIWSYSLCYYP